MLGFFYSAFRCRRFTGVSKTGSVPAALRHCLEELAPPWHAFVEDNKQINRTVYDL